MINNESNPKAVDIAGNEVEHTIRFTVNKSASSSPDTGISGDIILYGAIGSIVVVAAIASAIVVRKMRRK